MASTPFFDPAGRGRWRMTWHDGRGWRKVTLGHHPTAWDRARPPRKPPADILARARQYEDRERSIREGRSVAGEGPGPVELAGYFAAYRESYHAGHAEASRACLRGSCSRFLAWAAGRGLVALADVREIDCLAYLEGRLAEGAERTTVVTEKSYLQPIWSRAVRDRIVPSNPWRGARVPGKRKQEAASFWSRDELARLVAACDEWTRTLVVVGSGLGLRIASLLALEWPDVDFARGVVVVRAKLPGNKGGRRHEVPLSARVRGELEGRAAGSGFVLARAGGRKPPAACYAYRLVRDAVLRAGLPEKGSYNHILRHTFASHAVLAGVPLPVVSKWLGHANISQTMRYAHLCPDGSAEMMRRLDAAMAQEGGQAPDSR